MALALPSYTPSAPLPSYSSDPACGEQRLDHTPRRILSNRSTSVFTKKAGTVTIILTDQEEGTSTPIYGRFSVVSGDISLENRQNILEVVACVEGKLESTFSEAGGGTHKLIKNRYTLWSRSSSSNELCPGEISFGFILPSCFKYGDENVPLPPSFLEHFVDVPVLFVKVAYQLRFVITRIPYKQLGIWQKKKTIVIPFKYYPRTRAYRPILRLPNFFSSVKTSPEEWYQAVTCLKTKLNVKVDPIYCHLFIPAGRVYGVHDIIPFHVQLSANTSVLSELFSSGPLLNRITSADTCNSKKSQIAPKPLIRVYLVRQVLISMKNATSWRNTVLGDGTIWPVPPAFFSCSCDAIAGCQERHVDWEGEVRCREGVNVGGFEAVNVQVKDYITLSMAPPRDRPSPLLDLNISVPIKLVTDSFSDLTFMDTAAS